MHAEKKKAKIQTENQVLIDRKSYISSMTYKGYRSWVRISSVYVLARLIVYNYVIFAV